MLVFKQISLVIKIEDHGFYKIKHCNARKLILENIIILLPLIINANHYAVQEQILYPILVQV